MILAILAILAILVILAILAILVLLVILAILAILVILAILAIRALKSLQPLFPDDPYYCGLRARIPNFAKSKAQKEKEAKYGRIGERRDKEGHPMVWHGPQRGYLENGEPPSSQSGMKLTFDPQE